MLPTNFVSYIYNPLNQTEEELLKSFVVREDVFKTIFNGIEKSSMEHPEFHTIIQGQRGQGKTTLLLKLYYEIKRHNKLKKSVIPIIFNEEQYHVNTLFDLWCHAAEKLEEEDERFIGLYTEVESAYDTGNRETEAFKRLENALKKKKKKMILLMDNIGQLLDKLSDREQQRLREVLISCAALMIVGASAAVLESTFDYSKPFYEQFHIVNLDGLTQKETETLLLKLGEHYKQENVKRIVEQQPGRVEVLRRLTGGVPRTMVLLFEIFVDSEEGSAFYYLEFVLDRVTPLYKHRMDDLSPQQQKIVDAIALNWDAMATKEIAEKTRMESKAVSSHLKLLEKNRVIHKVKTTTKNYFYQVTERFFNIWYLMRYGRRQGKKRVQWLVHFLESWCSETELNERVMKHIQALKKGTLYPKYALYFSEALAGTQIHEDLQHDLITQTREFLNKRDKSLLNELSKSDFELYEEAGKYYKNGEYEKALRCLETIQNKNVRVLYNIALIFDVGLKDSKKAEKYYLMAVKKGDSGAMYNLAHLYKNAYKDFWKAEKYYLMAVEKGHSGAMYNLANLYRSEYKDFNKAERYYLMAVEKGDEKAMTNLARLYFVQHKNKLKTLELITRASTVKDLSKEDKIIVSHHLSLILLWNDKIEESLKLYHELMTKEEYIESLIGWGNPYLLLLMAKKQYYSALKIFNETPFNLKERIKPVYYALMYFFKEDFPNEYKRMGGELRQTVEEIIAIVKQWEKDYA